MEFSISVLNQITEELITTMVPEELAFTFANLSKGKTGIINAHCDDGEMIEIIDPEKFDHWSWNHMTITRYIYPSAIEFAVSYRGRSLAYQSYFPFINCEGNTSYSPGEIKFTRYAIEGGDSYLKLIQRRITNQIAFYGYNK